MVLERNWLDVYPYQGWGGNANLPPLQEGQTFVPTELLLKEVGLEGEGGGFARRGRGELQIFAAQGPASQRK